MCARGPDLVPRLSPMAAFGVPARRYPGLVYRVIGENLRVRYRMWTCWACGVGTAAGAGSVVATSAEAVVLTAASTLGVRHL